MSCGGVKLKRVAAVVSIKPIRIKRLEDPNFATPHLNEMFMVMALYRRKVRAALKQ